MTNELHGAESLLSELSMATEGIPRPSWELKIHCRVHNNPPVVPVLTRSFAVQILTSSLFKTHRNTRPLPSISAWLSQILHFATKMLRAFLIFLTRATCSLTLIPLFI